MALRKDYTIPQLGDSGVKAEFKALAFEKDNGTVVLTVDNNKILLSYKDIAHLYGTAYPEQEYNCDGTKKEHSFASLTQEERDAYNAHFA